MAFGVLALRSARSDWKGWSATASPGGHESSASRRRRAPAAAATFRPLVAGGPGLVVLGGEHLHPAAVGIRLPDGDPGTGSAGTSWYWELSVTLNGQFCRDALERALAGERPEIFNTDQGAQFANDAFTSLLRAAEVQNQHGGPWPGAGQRFVERLWRSKYEEVYLKDYAAVREARAELKRYFAFYSHGRPY